MKISSIHKIYGILSGFPLQLIFGQNGSGKKKFNGEYTLLFCCIFSRAEAFPLADFI